MAGGFVLPVALVALRALARKLPHVQPRVFPERPLLPFILPTVSIQVPMVLHVVQGLVHHELLLFHEASSTIGAFKEMGSRVDSHQVPHQVSLLGVALLTVRAGVGHFTGVHFLMITQQGSCGYNLPTVRAFAGLPF